MSSNEPEFLAWRKRLLTKLAVLCVLAIPVGLCIAGGLFCISPRISDREVISLVVAILGVMGLIVSLVKLEKLK